MQRIMVLVLLCLCSGVTTTRSCCLQPLSAAAQYQPSHITPIALLCVIMSVYKKGHVHDLKGAHSSLFLFVPENLMV